MTCLRAMLGWGPASHARVTVLTAPLAATVPCTAQFELEGGEEGGELDEDDFEAQMRAMEEAL